MNKIQFKRISLGSRDNRIYDKKKYSDKYITIYTIAILLKVHFNV